MELIRLETGKWTDLRGPTRIWYITVTGGVGLWRIEVRDRRILMLRINCKAWGGGFERINTLQAPTIKPVGRLFRVSRGRFDEQPVVVVEVR